VERQDVFQMSPIMTEVIKIRKAHPNQTKMEYVLPVILEEIPMAMA
tara:strand:+ start:563 stop:700 length:138 start_codon:yes stop_codon:yes gene_type:complete